MSKYTLFKSESLETVQQLVAFAAERGVTFTASKYTVGDRSQSATMYAVRVKKASVLMRSIVSEFQRSLRS